MKHSPITRSSLYSNSYVYSVDHLLFSQYVNWDMLSKEHALKGLALLEQMKTKSSMTFPPLEQQRNH